MITPREALETALEAYIASRHIYVGDYYDDDQTIEEKAIMRILEKMISDRPVKESS